MDNVIDLTGDDLVHPPVRCPNTMSSDGIDDDELCVLTDSADAGVVALKAASAESGASTSRTWRLPNLEEDHMQEVVDLLLPQPQPKVSPSTPQGNKQEALKEPAPPTTILHSQKSLKKQPNIPQTPNVTFKTPRTIRITRDVGTSHSPPFAANGSIRTRVKRARQPFQFLQLPPEIRNRVYNLLLTTSEPIEMTRARQTTATREGKLSFPSIHTPHWPHFSRVSATHVSAASALMTYFETF